MDTLSKGEDFENTVFNIMRGELESERLGITPSLAKLYRGKGYFSKDRNSEITFDISIEIWPPKAKNYSILWICECKDYSRRIPVDDIEEFKAKLDQIAGKNIKGVIASPNALQQGALEYARANSIGVIRILPNNQVTWVWHMITSLDTKERLDQREFAMALINQNHRGHNRSFYATYEGYIFGDCYSLLSHSLKI